MLHDFEQTFITGLYHALAHFQFLANYVMSAFGCLSKVDFKASFTSCQYTRSILVKFVLMCSLIRMFLRTCNTAVAFLKYIS